MQTIGLVISHKNNERRRALLPSDLKNIKNVQYLYFEKGYGESLGIDDSEYLKHGANIVSREEALTCDVIIDVKLGDANYFKELKSPKILVGWAHAVQNIEFTSAVMDGNHTVLAWEELYENGRYIFYRNREIAGEAAILQGFRFSGKLPYDAKVAIIGNGQTAKGAFKILAALGADVDIYARKNENQFRTNMFDYDVLVNCVMWDTNRMDRLIYKEDLKKFRKGTLIIDISCDPHLEIETSHPTTIDDPIYVVDDIVHYAVDNTPAMYPKSVTKNLSKEFCVYIDYIINGQYTETLKKAIVISKGRIVAENIKTFRMSRGIYC